MTPNFQKEFNPDDRPVAAALGSTFSAAATFQIEDPAFDPNAAPNPMGGVA